MTPAEAYAILATAGHDLTWREQATAKVPTPDEREALKLSEAAVMPVVHRTTIDRTGNQPTLLETTHLGAETTAPAYPIDARQPTPKRTPRTKTPRWMRPRLGAGLYPSDVDQWSDLKRARCTACKAVRPVCVDKSRLGA
uniref:Uncharacterized protein n=1 Tax=Streptomyces citricolor TaxID=212427 RepID=A0A7R6JWI6_9ACTN|nr:hypothetical protein [Streptomyces citricolor]